jgi:hypothetical protein
MVVNDRMKVKFECRKIKFDEELTLEDIHNIFIKTIENPNKLIQDIKTEIIDIKDANNKRGRGLPQSAHYWIEKSESEFNYIAYRVGFDIISEPELINRFGPYKGVKGAFNLVLDKIYYSLDRLNLDAKKYGYWPHTDVVCFLLDLHQFKGCIEQRRIHD